MILVTLGTQDKSFSRLLQAIEQEIDNKNIQEEVIVQAGYTKYQTDKMKILNMIPKDEFLTLLDQCDFMISHGGVGSIFDGLKKNKKIIVAPRLVKYNEHTNDHQLQVVEQLSKEGYVLALHDMKDLNKLLKEIKNFQPNQYQSNNQNIINLLEDYIEKHHRRRIFSSKRN